MLCHSEWTNTHKGRQTETDRLVFSVYVIYSICNFTADAETLLFFPTGTISFVNDIVKSERQSSSRCPSLNRDHWRCVCIERKYNTNSRTCLSVEFQHVKDVSTAVCHAFNVFSRLKVDFSQIYVVTHVPSQRSPKGTIPELQSIKRHHVHTDEVFWHRDIFCRFCRFYRITESWIGLNLKILCVNCVFVALWNHLRLLSERLWVRDSLFYKKLNLNNFWYLAL